MEGNPTYLNSKTGITVDVMGHLFKTCVKCANEVLTSAYLNYWRRPLSWIES